MNGTGLRSDGAFGARRWRAIGARILTVSLGLAAVGWSGFVAPVAWRQTSMAPLGTKIVAGERFKAGTLEQYLFGSQSDIGDGLCQPVTLRTLAIVRVRLAEEAISDGDRALIEQTQSAGETFLRRSLLCTPTDPFLWFALFWMQNSSRGLQQDNFRLLRLSYRVGPNEGWLSIRRNRVAIAIYPSLPDDLKQAATAEFVQLVRSDLITEAADILAGPGRPVSKMLLTRLQGVDERKVRLLSTLLAGKGIDEE
jgi:hypothetical protein